MTPCQEKRFDAASASAVAWVSMKRAFASRLRHLANSDTLSRGPASFRCKAELGVCGVREDPRRLVKLTSGVLFCAGWCSCCGGSLWAGRCQNGACPLGSARLGGPQPLWERALEKRRQEQAFEKVRRGRSGRPLRYYPTELGVEAPPHAPPHAPPQKPVEAPPLKRHGAASTHPSDYIAAYAPLGLPPLRGAGSAPQRGDGRAISGSARSSDGAEISVDPSAVGVECGPHAHVGPGGEDAPRATRRARAGAGGAHEGRASGVRARRDRRRRDFDLDRVGEVHAAALTGGAS
jgi:hypothetical protein